MSNHGDAKDHSSMSAICLGRSVKQEIKRKQRLVRDNSRISRPRYFKMSIRGKSAASNCGDAKDHSSMSTICLGRAAKQRRMRKQRLEGDNSRILSRPIYFKRPIRARKIAEAKSWRRQGSLEYVNDMLG